MIGRRAVVIGGGIAGLTAARALAHSFERVIVFDRDSISPAPVPRKGVPQGEHGHTLLAGGRRALTELFPGLTDELVAAGAVEFDHGLGLSFAKFGVVWPHLRTGLTLTNASRPLLESTLLRRLTADEGVQIRDGSAVSDLTSNGGRVTGVVLDDGRTVGADLVVDCTGRGNRSNQWLTAMGFEPPASVEIKVGVGYATRTYRRAAADLDAPKASFALPVPPDEFRAGLAMPVEGGRWLVSLGGWHGRFPHGAEHFDEHAAALPHPAIAAIVTGCEPLSDVAVIRFPASRRRYFEKLRRVPAGYLTLGDAICSFNPIYGQGMACAALQAVALDGLLRRHRAVTPALSAAYYARAAKVVATPWKFAAGGDLVYPTTEGPRPRGSALTNAYVNRIQLACLADPAVRRTFISVQHLVRDPSALLRPGMVRRVLRAARAGAAMTSASSSGVEVTRSPA